MNCILNVENPFQWLLIPTESLFHMETEYMAAPYYFQNGDNIRREGVRLRIRSLSQTPGLVHDRFVPFLALNYFDRFISRHRVLAPMGLFITACVTLAWKMRRPEFTVQQLLAARPLMLLGGDDSWIPVEVRHIERAESAILSALNWRSQSITPLCFLSFFMKLVGIDDPQQIQTLGQRVYRNQILYMNTDIRFTRFRPSIIALVGIMAERQEDRLDNFWNPVRVCEFVNQQDMDDCLNLLDVVRAEEIANALVPQFAAPPQVPAAAVVPQNAAPPQVPDAVVVPPNAAPPQGPQIDDPLQPPTPPQQE